METILLEDLRCHITRFKCDKLFMLLALVSVICKDARKMLWYSLIRLARHSKFFKLLYMSTTEKN